MARSIADWSAGSAPFSASAISPLTFETALPTALPPYSSPPSRSSTASYSPVDAPDGTAARPRAPESSTTSTSTVGLPRESSTCLPWTLSIAAIGLGKLVDGQPPASPGRLAEGELRVHAEAARGCDRLQQQRADQLLGLGPRRRIGPRAARLLRS